MKKRFYQDLYEGEEKHWWHLSKRALIHDLIRKYFSDKKLTILDLGCGTGKNMEEMRNFGDVYGVDQSEEAIEFCKKRNVTHVMVGNAEVPAFSKESFDLVTALDLLEHTDDKKVLKGIHRMLRSDGIIILTVPALPSLWSQWDEDLEHRRRYTKELLRNLLLKEQFEILYMRYLYSFLVVPACIVRTAKGRIFKTQYPSDFNLSNSLLNWVFIRLVWLESAIAKMLPIPFGTSLICVAKRT